MPALRTGVMQDSLLAWYAQNGRELPWRGTRDPYDILVSEVMLQQYKRVVGEDPLNPA